MIDELDIICNMQAKHEMISREKRLKEILIEEDGIIEVKEL